MKRGLVVGGVIILIITLSCYIPVTQKKETTILADFYNSILQISNPQQWKKWHPVIKDAWKIDSGNCTIIHDTATHSFTIKTPGDVFTVQAVTPVAFEVKEKIKSEEVIYSLAAEPSPLPNKMNIYTVKKVSLLNFLFPPNKQSPDEITVESFKKFLEDPLLFYGYPITVESVVDTNVVVKRETIVTKNWRDNLSAMYQSIDKFIHANHLEITQPRMAYFGDISADSMQIMAGISVNNTAPSNDEVQCIQMPKGNMLVGKYKGPYYGKKNLYDAMERYLTDHKLQLIAAPYERYLNDTIPPTDSSVVEIKLYFPIF